MPSIFLGLNAILSLFSNGIYDTFGASKGGTPTMRRSKLSNSKSRRLFTKTAQRVNSRNMSGAPMRGGIRL